ncbi:DNA mismatch repair protein MutS [Clostridia bacterium]|nr:DNA mismatch repair protein MutS [Clostridia bacterium]
MAQSPMMNQYFEIKRQNEGALLFYRLGDFYEMFYDDAVTASRELDLTLTHRDAGDGRRAPMCGVPFHAVDSYILKLIEKGYRVAICEQGEIVAKAKLVERKVVRTVTRGTADCEMLRDNENNYILCAYGADGAVGVAWADITTGEFDMREFPAPDALNRLDDCLVRLRPAEIICNVSFIPHSKKLNSVVLEQVPPFYAYLQGKFNIEDAAESVKGQLSAFRESADKRCATIAAGVLLQYISETQKRTLPQINELAGADEKPSLALDYNTRRNLELTETIRDRKRSGSLLWLLDKTVTPMGRRQLKEWLEQPLRDIAGIEYRQDGVEELLSDLLLRSEFTAALKDIRDMERLVSRLAFNNFNPPHAIQLTATLRSLARLKTALRGRRSAILRDVYGQIDPLAELAALLDAAIDPEKKVNFARDGGFIRKGFDTALDGQTELLEGGEALIKKLEEEERRETGIKNLKIAFNSVFGYYIEVSKSQLELVPYSYMRKQTVANGERFITPELKKLEERITSASDKALEIELKLYAEICAAIGAKIKEIQRDSRAVKTLDCLLSFATAAFDRHYTRPKITEGDALEIVGGRHPVVEITLKSEPFTPNDLKMNGTDDRVLIITGPNMGGKSTYMRQAALITLIAHTGGFVPAERAVVPLTDRIFTRIGASDDLAFGQSTFMVEMTELAAILKNCTEKSLVILDEIGRGTSTYDGLTIARAVIEYLSSDLKCKTLFSTHYHELTELEDELHGVKNYCVTVQETEDSVVFLHKIARGAVDRSFGVEVAKLAGLPDKVIARAKALMQRAEKRD